MAAPAITIGWHYIDENGDANHESRKHLMYRTTDDRTACGTKIPNPITTRVVTGSDLGGSVCSRCNHVKDAAHRNKLKKAKAPTPLRTFKELMFIQQTVGVTKRQGIAILNLMTSDGF